MILILMRHGEALQEVNDSSRPLSARGKEEAAKAAEQLKRRGYAISRIYHSTKKRAAETAQIVAGILGTESCLKEKEGIAPNDPVIKIEQELEELVHDPDLNALMLVGHLPLLGDLAQRLIPSLGRRTSFNTGTILCLKNPSDFTWTLEAVIHPD